MTRETGNLSINSENFLPIIKKWLYTDKDIFIRELVSNACDAVTKLTKLMSMGEATTVPADESFSIHLRLDKENRTLQISDNGIGMTSDEIKKYINQIAFSGASDFLSKYQEKLDPSQEIIGHFGLGFYSAFMVADEVEIDTLSFEENALPAKWTCQGGIDFQMDAGSRTARGTTITLHIGSDGEEFLEEGTLYAALKKYCSFMPVPIFLDVVAKEEEPEQKEPIHITPEEAENLTPEEIIAKETDAAEKEPTPLNNTHPLWTKSPKDCTKEEYEAFYREVFHDGRDPLFWIHLNMDYPFRLKGILYFPKLVEQMDVTEGQIKLFANQVYIADNIKEVLPEFLLLLKGVIDCPDMPLNVSRSALQNDGYSSKMSSYISKKVADRLTQMFKNEREEYQGFWDDISIFIKYGCMKEEKLYDKLKSALLFKTTQGDYATLEEYLEKAKDHHENKVFYVTDETQQAQYVRLFESEGLSAIVMTTPIDKPFVSFLEHKNPSLRLQRIDADIEELLKKDADTGEADEKTNEELTALFTGLLDKKELKVKMQSLKTKHLSSLLLLGEDSRRQMEMMEVYAQNPELQALFGHIKGEETLVLNGTHPLVQHLVALKGQGDKTEDLTLFCKQIYDLALLGHKPMTAEEMTAFLERSNLILEKLAGYVKG